LILPLPLPIRKMDPLLRVKMDLPEIIKLVCTARRQPRRRKQVRRRQQRCAHLDPYNDPIPRETRTISARLLAYFLCRGVLQIFARRELRCEWMARVAVIGDTRIATTRRVSCDFDVELGLWNGRMGGGSPYIGNWDQRCAEDQRSTAKVLRKCLMADQMDGEAYSEEELFRGFVLERILNEGFFQLSLVLITRSPDKNSLPTRHLPFPQSNPHRREIRLLHLPRIPVLPVLHDNDAEPESHPEERHLSLVYCVFCGGGTRNEDHDHLSRDGGSCSEV
jgi:hypothetical protein